MGGGNGPISHFAGMWARGGTATRPEPEQVEREWWEGVADVRTAIDDLAFVRGLSDGTLPEEAFGWYLAQDALYLRDYARVLAARELAESEGLDEATLTSRMMEAARG